VSVSVADIHRHDDRGGGRKRFGYSAASSHQ
jgi:hypothetical protein